MGSDNKVLAPELPGRAHCMHKHNAIIPGCLLKKPWMLFQWTASGAEQVIVAPTSHMRLFPYRRYIEQATAAQLVFCVKL